MITNKYNLLLFIMLNLLFNINAQVVPNKKADLIIFSFNRPLQLHALLKSVEKYFSNLNQIYVLCRIDSQEYEIAYKEVQEIFPLVKFVRQGNNPRSDFKPLLLQCFHGSSAEYIIFSVDDDIVKDFVDISECISALETFGGYAFYLRLGANITVQYGQSIQLLIPQYEEVQKDIYKFKFKDGIGDWSYPHNLDMTVFSKFKIESFYRGGNYSSPNTLESLWSGVADLNNYGLCYKTSKKFMLPLNIVQQDWWVPNENSFTAMELLKKWQQGFCIDINQFAQINNNCVLMGYIPVFVKRD